MFPCSLYKFTAVPLFLKNKLRCSPKLFLLSSRVSRNYAPCSLDPQIYSSLFPTISLMFHFHFRLLKENIPGHYFKKVSLWGKICTGKQPYNRETNPHGRKRPPFVTQYHPALPSRKRTLIGKWHLIQNQQQLRKICKKPPRSYRKGKSLKFKRYRTATYKRYINSIIIIIIIIRP